MKYKAIIYVLLVFICIMVCILLVSSNNNTDAFQINSALRFNLYDHYRLVNFPKENPPGKERVFFIQTSGGICEVAISWDRDDIDEMIKTNERNVELLRENPAISSGGPNQAESFIIEHTAGPVQIFRFWGGPPITDTALAFFPDKKVLITMSYAPLSAEMIEVLISSVIFTSDE